MTTELSTNPRFDDNGDIVACDKPLRSVTSLITEMSCADTTGAHRVTSEAAVEDGNSGATALHAVAKVPAASDRASTKADSQPQQSNFNPVNRQINGECSRMSLSGDCGVASTADAPTAAKVLAPSAGATVAACGAMSHRRQHHQLPRSSYNNIIPDDQYSTAVTAALQPLSQNSPGQGGQQLAASAEDQDQNKQLTIPLLPFASPSDDNGLGPVDSKDCIDVMRQVCGGTGCSRGGDDTSPACSTTRTTTPRKEDKKPTAVDDLRIASSRPMTDHTRTPTDQGSTVAKNIPNVISSTSVIDKRSYSRSDPHSPLSPPNVSLFSPALMPIRHQTDATKNDEGSSKPSHNSHDVDRPNDAFKTLTITSSENDLDKVDKDKATSAASAFVHDDSPSSSKFCSDQAAFTPAANSVAEEAKEPTSSQLNATCSSFTPSQNLSKTAAAAAAAADDLKDCIGRPVMTHQLPQLANTTKKRGWGWGPTPIGLRGGGESAIANGGSTGWGPPPPTNAGASRGWGAVPPNPNPTASAAWGAAPNPVSANVVNDEPSNSSNGAAAVAKNPSGGSGGNATPPSQPTSAAAAAAAAAAPTTSTSWAAAAGKGLPTHANDASGVVGPAGGNGQPNAGGAGSASNASKHALESLQSVRDALFSQDGWGGSNVKQDNSWDIGNAGDGTGMPKKPDGGAPGGASGNRNDGTDLWKSNLSGNPPPVAKPQQQTNPWGSYTPRVDNDGGTWGEDESRSGENHGGAGGGQPLGPPGSMPVGSAAPGSGFGPNGGGGNSFGGNPSQGGPGGRDGGGNFWNQDQANGPGFGPPKSKQDEWGNSNPGPSGGSNWGDPRGGPQRDADLNHVRNDRWSGQPQRQTGGGGGNWGAPPPPAGGAGGGRAPGVWDHESPNMTRRPGMDEPSGTYHWGGGREKPPGPPGSGVSNWKDMPTPGPGPMPPSIRPGPGGPRGLHPPNKTDVWSAGPSNRPWGEPDQPPPGGPPGGGGGAGSGWGDPADNMKPRDGLGWGDNSPGWGGAPTRPRNPGAIQRGSPGWGDPEPPMGGDNSGWGPKPPAGPKKMATSDVIWSSKQFRILCDMGISNNDAESALRQTNLNLEDALELLSSHGRMPPIGRKGPGQGPPGSDSLFQPPGGGGPYNNRRDGSQFGNGPGGMPFPPDTSNQAGLTPPLPGFNPMNPKVMPGNNGMMGGPGGNALRQPGTATQPPGAGGSGGGSNSQPSAQQLKLLVQQIQMAVTAGHLNPQILNQPLAPQTLVLLNQLLQQIKTLQGYQHTMQTQKSMGGTSSGMSMLTVDITKTKQEIQNLQNQISAQQANYLKQQMPHSMAGGPPGGNSGGPPGTGGGPGSDGFGPGLLGQIGGGNASSPVGVGQVSGNLPSVPSDTGSRLNKWISNIPENTSSSGGFPKAPGGPKIPPITTTTATTMLDDTWGPPNTTTGSGWPDSSKSQGNDGRSAGGNNTNGTDIDNFGIPEFVPGKQWKGPGMKNPDEDPNLTPGSVAMSAVDLNPLSKAGSNSSLGVSAAAAAATSASSSSAENSLGLGGWGSTIASSSTAITKDTWSTNGMSGMNSTNLTQMGQDLWGKSAGGVGRTPPGLGAGTGGWPTSTSSSANGWGSNGGANGSAEGPCWLLLKNLTPQIDGSTLKTLCNQHTQHGPLRAFHLFLNQGLALAQFTTSSNAQKAQKALNGCPLNNTTIQAQSIVDADAESFLIRAGAATGGVPSRGATPSSLANVSKPSDSMGWGSSVAPSGGGGGSSSSTWGDLGMERSTPQLQSFLPNDLLGESNH